MDKEELEAFVTGLIDRESAEMVELAGGGVINGGKAESAEVMGALAERGRIDRISGEDIRKDRHR